MTTNIKQLFISTLGLIILGGGAVKAQEGTGSFSE
jgi:hypothetical protein